MQIEYNDFLKSKVKIAQSNGFTCDIDTINSALKPHNKLIGWITLKLWISFGDYEEVRE